MKAYLINILIFGGIFMLYYIGAFEMFTLFWFKVTVYVLVFVLLILGLFVFGNPFSKGENDEKK